MIAKEIAKLMDKYPDLDFEGGKLSYTVNMPNPNPNP